MTDSSSVDLIDLLERMAPPSRSMVDVICEGFRYPRLARFFWPVISWGARHTPWKHFDD